MLNIDLIKEAGLAIVQPKNLGQNPVCSNIRIN